MLFEKLNTYAVRTLPEGCDLGSMDFKPLKDFVNQQINVDGFFFTNGKYGKQVVVVGNGCKINLPARYVENFEELEKDEELVKAMLRGCLALTDISMVSTKNGTTTTFKFADR